MEEDKKDELTEDYIIRVWKKIEEDPYALLVCLILGLLPKTKRRRYMECKYCKHFKKESKDVDDDNAFGWCDKCEWGSYGSDPICVDFEHK